MTQQCPVCGSDDLVVVDDVVVATPPSAGPPDLRTCLACGWTSFRPAPHSEPAERSEPDRRAETLEV